MKIAIHKTNYGFDRMWIEYCQKKGIDYKIVNCYDNNIVEQLSDCDALMWHHHHQSIKDRLFAKQLLFALEQSGKMTFPDFRTGWYFDDKVAEKYLLEAIDAPLAKSYVFYSEPEALVWAKETSYPKIFKLRGGGGSENVRLVKSYKQAHKLISTIFGRGVSTYNRIGKLKERLRLYRMGKRPFIDICKGIFRLFIIPKAYQRAGRERDYVLFQDFIPNNTYDLRVIVIGDKAFAIRRDTRNNDFRASGSGQIKYAKEYIDISAVKTAFDVAKKLGTQCTGFDFVFDHDHEPIIIEMGYGFVPGVYNACEGYYDSSLVWHAGKFDPYGWMVDLMLEKKNNGK